MDFPQKREWFPLPREIRGFETNTCIYEWLTLISR